jgi:hypothetical protein
MWPTTDSLAERLRSSRSMPPIGMQHELTAGEHGRWRNDEAFTLELVVRAGFVLADALGLRGREEMQLPAALALLLGSDPGATHRRLPVNGLKIVHGRLVFYVT